MFDEEPPSYKFAIGLVCVACGLLFIIAPPMPGQPMGRRLGGLRGPPLTFTYVIAGGVVAFGILVIVLGIKEMFDE